MSKAKIHYYDIGDYLSREDKLRIIKQFGSVENIPWTILEPNEHGDWINHRNEMFKDFILLGDKDDKKNKRTFFVPYYSRGLATARDAWCYNFNKQKLISKLIESIDYYNQQRESYNNTNKDIDVRSFVTYNDNKLSWNRGLLNYCKSNKVIRFESDSIRKSIYRPFQTEWGYFNVAMNDMTYQLDKLFPTSNHKNLVICVSGIGVTKDFSCIITDTLPDLELIGKSQCFPLYWYDSSDADVADLFNQGAEKPMDRYVRKDGVTDWILSTARKQYGYKVTKEDIFYYVYGLLHSPDYRTTFATDLKKSLPRLPLVEKVDDFWAFSKAGRELANLHLNYETIEPYRKCIVSFAPLTNKGDKINYHVEKMRFGKIDSKTSDKSVIYYNNSITITGIPAKAYEYVVNGKSAIEWIMERYAITTDKKSGITNDPNDWAREHNDEKYILNLLLRVINVSVQTVEIVKGLPKLKFEE